MQSAKLAMAVSKLATAGEQAGLALEQMIAMPDAGVGLEDLLSRDGISQYGMMRRCRTTEESARVIPVNTLR